MKSLIFTTLLMVTTAAMACTSKNICPGDRIITSKNYTGDVLEVINDNKIKVYLDMGSFYHYLSQKELSKGVKCHQDICVGDRINETPSNIRMYVGKVVEVFDNGKAKVWFDGWLNYSVRARSDIGIGYRCIEKLCKGDRVSDTAGITGTVEEIFDNGNIRIFYPLRKYKYSVLPINELDINLNCQLGVDCQFIN